MRRALALLAASVTLVALVAYSASGATRPSNGAAAAKAKPTAPLTHWCNTNGVTCAEPFQNWEDFPFFDRLEQQGVKIDEYIGHDEPSVLFYSSVAGSGNNANYTLSMPNEPLLPPRQDGSGGTYNFQQHVAPWLGMAMCDDQGAPNPDWSGAAYPNVPCTPDSDSNIFKSDNASSPKYIGKHPGTAYMEMQFYPPGWVKWPLGTSCDAHAWCMAINIWSLSIDQNTNTPNNNSCLNSAGIEPGNFAYITKNGKANVPANPLQAGRYNLPPKKNLLLIGSGDKVNIDLHDSAQGFVVDISDLTTGAHGSMTASVANGFGSVHFDPNAASCSVDLHAFHPAYATSSPATRVSWAAHSYNVAYSDEIGHWEYCNKVDQSDLSCIKPGGYDTHNGTDPDDVGCMPVNGFPSTLIKIKGCLGTDGDFDGTSYDEHAWPGTTANAQIDRMLAGTPWMFTSPTFNNGREYGQVAFEADLPRIEDADTAFGIKRTCQRHVSGPGQDPNPGRGCVKPPPQSRFYPTFSTVNVGGVCYWAEGGPYLQHKLNDFGGIREYGPLFASDYPVNPPGSVSVRYQVFRGVLGNNPCTKG
jgi:hypothetical protein